MGHGGERLLAWYGAGDTEYRLPGTDMVFMVAAPTADFSSIPTSPSQSLPRNEANPTSCAQRPHPRVSHGPPRATPTRLWGPSPATAPQAGWFPAAWRARLHSKPQRTSAPVEGASDDHIQ
jgi:hypothetical protein